MNDESNAVLFHSTTETTVYDRIGSLGALRFVIESFHCKMLYRNGRGSDEKTKRVCLIRQIQFVRSCPYGNIHSRDDNNNYLSV